MDSKLIWRVLPLTVLAALVLGAGQVRAQGEPQVYGEDYAPADPVWPFPIGSTHPEDGGLFVSAGFASYRQTNPLHGQAVASRGFEISEPSAAIQNSTGANFLTTLGLPGTFFGSKSLALDVSQVSGPTDFEPGFTAEVGWKFGDGSSFSVKWLFIDEVNLGASATLAPPGQNTGCAFRGQLPVRPRLQLPVGIRRPAKQDHGPEPEFRARQPDAIALRPRPGRLLASGTAPAS